MFPFIDISLGSHNFAGLRATPVSNSFELFGILKIVLVYDKVMCSLDVFACSIIRDSFVMHSYRNAVFNPHQAEKLT